MNILPSNSGQSPFDSIKRINAQGIEIWRGRELMPILGYARWDRVPDVIERAKISCQNAGIPHTEHFSEETRKTLGRDQQDFDLSRYACYLVAMNGDPRKKEIAQAQSYFAIKTHQSELADQKIVTQSRTPLSEILDAIDHIYKGVNLKQELIAGVKINAAKHMAPDAAIALEEARQPLIVNTAQKDELITPTAIGKILGVSGQAVNKLLTERSLQVPNGDRKSKKEPAYLPTEKGRAYSDLTLATGSSSSSTYQQLRWYKSVVSALQ